MIQNESQIKTRSALRDSESELAEVKQRQEAQSLELQRVQEMLHKAQEAIFY